MARLLPSTPDTSAAEEAALRVIGVDDADADDLLAAMSSGTARRILAALHDEPAAPSELADEVDTSLQNVQYHLGNLADAGAVEVIDTVYSEKGREMKVYAPADRPLVVVAGGEEETAGLEHALASLLGGLGLLALASLAVDRLVGDRPTGAAGAAPGAPEAGGGGGGVGIAAVEPTATPAPTPGGGGGFLPPLDLLASPGGLFFLGGTAVLLIGFAVWFARR